MGEKQKYLQSLGKLQSVLDARRIGIEELGMETQAQGMSCMVTPIVVIEDDEDERSGDKDYLCP